MKCEQLSAWTFPVRLALVLLVVAGSAAMTPYGVAAQTPLEEGPLEAPVVPIPGATPRAARMRGAIPCSEVISRVNHNLSAEKGRTVNVAVVARTLGTTKVWVAHCMIAYGRRVPVSLQDVENEDALEKLEEDEPEESAAEDVEEPGAKERNTLEDENPHDRQELRADHPKPGTPDKERVLRLRPQSSDNADEEY